MSRTPLAAAALLAACLLGACSDDDPKPDIADPSPSAPSTSATVSTSPPTQTSAPPPSPRQSVDAWLIAWTVAMQTGETDSVSELSSTDCQSCERLISKVAEVYGKGGRYETDGWSATRVSEAPDSVSETPSYVMQVVQTRRSLYGADGQLVDVAPRTKVPMRMTFQRVDEVWLLARLEILE
jgi:hypothetical protein